METTTTTTLSPLKEDAVKLQHILKMTVDFDDMELLSPEGKELWRRIQQELEITCNRLNQAINSKLLCQ